MRQLLASKFQTRVSQLDENQKHRDHHLRRVSSLPVEHRFLFNFSASYTGGGYKRLHAYAGWFDKNGGAWFAIHPRCSQLIEEFPANRFFVIAHSPGRRLIDDWSYLNGIVRNTGQPRLYYAYGIPLYRRLGDVNWAHLQNILLVGRHDVALPPFLRAKLAVLGWRFRRGLRNADVVSAESHYSLQLMGQAGFRNLYLSPNGNDDALEGLRRSGPVSRDNIATAVGTISYKALEDTMTVFETLRRISPGLELVVFGAPEWVPAPLRRHPHVHLRGLVPRAQVIECLRRSRFFISTSRVENSSNAAAEGMYLAERSFVTDIPPHAELLFGERFERVELPGLSRPLLHVEMNRLHGANITVWDSVIRGVIARVEMLEGCAPLLRGPRRVLETRTDEQHQAEQWEPGKGT